MTSREAFEKWCRDCGLFTDWSRYGDGYAKPMVERSWLAWQAAIRWSAGDGEIERGSKE